MRILYGVQATGNGHINRSREIVKELKNRGHDVLTIFSGRSPKKFWDITEFEPYIMFRGMTFKTKNGRIKHFKTVANLRLIQFFNDIEKVCDILQDFDLVISDYEPITLRAASKSGVFSINLSHQACFHYNNIPLKKTEPISLWITKNFAKGDMNIGIHWDQFDERNIIIPPIVPDHLKNQMVKNKCLVYLPFENTHHVVDILSKLPSYDFFVYSGVEFDNQVNITNRPFSREGFLNDLQESEIIISNAGFELISESLYLGRKIIAKPVINQMEQESNAECIEKLGIGKCIKKLEIKTIEKLLKESEIKQIKYSNTQKLFVDWVEKNSFDLDDLMENIWSI